MDISSMRISNGWILCSLLAGLWYAFFGPGGNPGEYITGILFPAAALGWLFILRMLGPGDIKLLCALGGIMGPGDIWRCMKLTFLAGAVLSLAILLDFGDSAGRIRYFIAYLKDVFETGIIKPYYKRGSAPENFHFTIPIFMSVMLYAGGMY